MDFLSWLSSNEDLGFLFVVSGTGGLIALVAIVSSTIRSVRLGERQLELKQSMVEQGMSADDIQRVLKM